MRVLLAGTSGLAKTLALENLRVAAEKLFPSERIFSLPNSTGQKQIPILDQFIYKTSPIPFLKMSSQAQKQAWRKAFDNALSEFNRAQNEHHLLGLHFTYRYEQIPICVVDFGRLVDWKPECIVTLIDDAYCVRQRIHEGGYKSFTLAELILWRAEETLIGDLLARTIDPHQPPPNYVVSVKHSPEMLARLLLQRNDIARVYLSYKISETRNSQQYRKIIDEFRSRMAKQSNCAAFDPLTIDELPLVRSEGEPNEGYFDYDGHDPNHRWPIGDDFSVLSPDKNLPYPIRIPIPELLDVRKAIDAQIKNRDIRLVDQSHYLIVYRPTLAPNRDGTPNPKLGSGVQGEVDHAHESGCPVIWYIKKDEDPLPESPFVEKDPSANPYLIYEPTEEKFWAKIGTLHAEVDRERDNFLK